MIRVGVFLDSFFIASCWCKVISRLPVVNFVEKELYRESHLARIFKWRCLQVKSYSGRSKHIPNTKSSETNFLLKFYYVKNHQTQFQIFEKYCFTGYLDYQYEKRKINWKFGLINVYAHHSANIRPQFNQVRQLG